MSERYQEIQRSYRILGAEIGAPLDTLRKNYLELIKVWHPDVSEMPVLEAEVKAKEINEALTRIKSLSPIDIRAAKRHFKARRKKPKYKRAHKKSARRAARQAEKQDHRSKQKAEAPARQRRRAPVSRRGRHMFSELELTPHQVKAGSRWRFKISTCRQCAGWGAAMGGDFAICRSCRGIGLRRIGESYEPETLCQRCAGQGSTFTKICQHCKGSGETDTLTVRCYIPPGDGSAYVGIIPGQGHRGVRGGKAGDLYLRILIKNN